MIHNQNILLLLLKKLESKHEEPGVLAYSRDRDPGRRGALLETEGSHSIKADEATHESPKMQNRMRFGGKKLINYLQVHHSLYENSRSHTYVRIQRHSAPQVAQNTPKDLPPRPVDTSAPGCSTMSISSVQRPSLAQTSTPAPRHWLTVSQTL